MVGILIVPLLLISSTFLIYVFRDERLYSIKNFSAENTNVEH